MPRSAFYDLFEDPNNEFVDMKVIDFEVAVHLGKNIEIIERTRYNFWDILGDVGGFNDGLYLVF